MVFVIIVNIENLIKNIIWAILCHSIEFKANNKKHDYFCYDSRALNNNNK